jgi:hypothetical protein
MPWSWTGIRKDIFIDILMSSDILLSLSREDNEICIYWLC